MCPGKVRLRESRSSSQIAALAQWNRSGNHTNKRRLRCSLHRGEEVREFIRVALVLPPSELVPAVRLENVTAVSRQVSFIGIAGSSESIDWIIKETIDAWRSASVFV